MVRRLVFVHGRSQQKKDAGVLKQKWIEYLSAGLPKTNPPLTPIADSNVKFPFYGDALAQMAGGVSPDKAAKVIVKGVRPGDAQGRELNAAAKRFMRSVLDEICEQYGITEDDVLKAADKKITKKGKLDWPFSRAILQKLDSLPLVSEAAIALATYDVYQYLTNRLIRKPIDEGVMEAMSTDIETVVVGHSLGTVVAYTLLQREGVRQGWKVPLFVTLGAPLAVTAIRALAPGIGGVGSNRTPACVTKWFNVMDSRDPIALHPLNEKHFPLNPADRPIENKIDVRNRTGNHHGIKGYLGDPEVAKVIYDAMH